MSSCTELTPDQLVDEIKAVYNVLASLDGGAILRASRLRRKKPSIPLKDIVTAKYVVCLECGKKLRTLKAHLRKAHGLMPKEYYQRFGLDPRNSRWCVKTIPSSAAKWQRKGASERWEEKRKWGFELIKALSKTSQTIDEQKLTEVKNP